MFLKIKRVAVGVSGGVDSAVTALLLKKKGFDVHGVFMQNWDIADEEGQCSADKDYKDAAIVCKQLRIPLHYINFVKHYWNYVFSNLLKEYENGYTPNPDILCNRHIKFDYFIKYAMDHLKADSVATGHYVNTSFGPYLENYDHNKNVKLLKASCIYKDQTFFLSQVHQESLKRVMFPLGQLMKADVKQLANDNGLHQIASKKESMGICFIGLRNFKNFISEYIDNKPGIFIDIDTNEIKGTHVGIHQWTVGQRSRLANHLHPSYIARKDPTTNIIYLAEGWHHQSLFSEIFFAEQPHWIDSKPEELTRNSVLMCDFKFQHVQTLQRCWICETTTGLVVGLQNPIRAITAGQYAVFYRYNECLGSARIFHPGPSQYFCSKYRRKRKIGVKNTDNHSQLDSNDSQQNELHDEFIESKMYSNMV